MTNPKQAYIKSWELCQTCYYHVRCQNTETCYGCDMRSDYLIPAEHHKTLCICNSIRDGGLCGNYINNEEKENNGTL